MAEEGSNKTRGVKRQVLGLSLIFLAALNFLLAFRGGQLPGILPQALGLAGLLMLISGRSRSL